MPAAAAYACMREGFVRDDHAAFDCHRAGGKRNLIRTRTGAGAADQTAHHDHDEPDVFELDRAGRAARSVYRAVDRRSASSAGRRSS